MCYQTAFTEWYICDLGSQISSEYKFRQLHKYPILVFLICNIHLFATEDTTVNVPVVSNERVKSELTKTFF